MAVDLERLAAARAAQGLPPQISDPVVLHRLAVLFSAPAVSVAARVPTNAPRAATGTGGSESVEPGAAS